MLRYKQFKTVGSTQASFPESFLLRLHWQHVEQRQKWLKKFKETFKTSIQSLVNIFMSASDWLNIDNGIYTGEVLFNDAIVEIFNPSIFQK